MKVNTFFQGDTMKLINALHNPRIARKARKARIVNRYTVQDIKNQARAAYTENPTIENLRAYQKTLRMKG